LPRSGGDAVAPRPPPPGPPRSRLAPRWPAWKGGRPMPSAGT